MYGYFLVIVGMDFLTLHVNEDHVQLEMKVDHQPVQESVGVQRGAAPRRAQDRSNPDIPVLET